MKSIGDLICEQLMLTSRTVQNIHDLSVLLGDDELATRAMELARSVAGMLALVLSRAIVEEGRKMS